MAATQTRTGVSCPNQGNFYVVQASESRQLRASVQGQSSLVHVTQKVTFKNNNHDFFQGFYLPLSVYFQVMVGAQAVKKF